MPEGIDRGLLEEYIATANSGKYKSMAEVHAKFPELKDYSPDLMEEYVATANSGKYKTLDEVNLKFPEFLTSAKPAVPSFSTDIKNTNILPVMKDSPLQANVAEMVVEKTVKIAKPVKEPVIPEVIQDNPFLKKANDLAWDKTPLGQEQKKTEIVGMLPQAPAKPTMAVKSEEDKIIELGINGLPALSKIMLKNNPIYDREFNDWLKLNPKEAERLNAWSKNKDAQSEYQKSQVFDKFQKDMLTPRIEKLKELEAMGAGEILKQKNDLYTNINKVSDDLKKKQTELNFYQNTFLEQSGNKALVDKVKELSGILKKYDREKITNTLTGIDGELTAISNEIGSITSPDNTIAQEYAEQYNQLYSRAKSLEQQRINIENDPEFLRYNAAIEEYNNVQKEINNNIGNLNNDPEYKKTVEGYTALFDKYKQIAGSIEGLKKDDPLVNEYLSLSKEVADRDKSYKSINSGFTIKTEIDKLQKEINEKGDFSGKLISIAQSIPQAVNMLAAGSMDLLNSVNEFTKLNDTSLHYTTLNKAADFYNNLSKTGSIIVPEAKAIKENGDINWADIPYEAFQQVGNLAVMAATGGESKVAMVTSGYIMSRKGRTDEAEEAGLKGASKEIYVNGLSFLEGLSELIMPDGQFFTKTVKEKLLKDAVLAQTKGINWFRKEAIVTILENMGKESAEEYIVKLGELTAQYGNNLEQGKNVFDIKKSNTLNEWIRTALVAAPLAGVSTGLTKIGVPKKELDIARFVAAKNITQTRQILSDLVASGKITQEKADENYKQIIRYAAVQNVMPKDISPDKAVQLVPLIEENKQLELQIKTGGISDMFINSIKAKIKENNDKAQAILETPNTKAEIVPSVNLKASEEIKAETPASNTKFYQGVDFKAQTGLPNGDYTEEQVKAARENKLKEAGVTPAEIEKTINAEQEIVPATETPAAPISGVSGEVQESGDVTPITTNEQQNDKENGTGIQSNIGEGQEPVKTQPVETTGGEKIETGRNVQTYEKEIADLRAKEQAEYAALKNPTKEAKKKIYDKYDKLITPLIREEKAASKEVEVSDKEGDTSTTKSENFFNDADKLFPNDHVLGGYAVTNSEGTLIGRIQLSEVNENTVKIDEIVSEKRGQKTGNGTAIMNKVIENADKNNVTLVLTANIIGEMKAKGFETPQKLQAFYEKFGFVKDKSKGTMIRMPKAAVNTIEVTPKEGDTSITKSARGMIQNMVFKDGEWQIKFGKDFTTVSSAVNQEAQDYFNEKNAPVAEVKEQAPVVENVPVEKTTSVYVAPFYDAMVKTTEEANDVEKSPAYKKYVQTINSVAEALGIKIKSVATNIGAYTNDDKVKVREVSTKVELETTNIDEATEFAVLMGALAPEVQESTIAAQGLSKEDIGTDKHTADLITVKVDNLEEAIAIAKKIGLDHTINLKENKIDFIDFNYWGRRTTQRFQKNLGKFITQLKEKGINYEAESESIESRFIESGADPKSYFGRKNVLERMAGALEQDARDTGDKGKDFQKRRQMLRDAIQEAIRRNNEFIRQQELASERAEYGKLRAKQIELEKNGERLSDEEIKRFTELLNVLIPSTQETIRNSADDYEEARKELEKVAAKVIGDLGFLSTFGIKRAERAATKILRWYKGKAQWLGDGARTNLIAYNEKDVMVIYKKLQAQFKGGVVRLEKDPTELGYPKKLLEVRTSNGKIGEFQVMTPEGYLAKDGVNGFPKEKRDFAAKELAKIQKRLGWLIPDGVGHYFYEIERDFNVPTDLRERAKAISLKYYDAFLKADSKYTEKEFLDEISQFKKDVDAADKTNWDKGNNGISPVTVNDFIEDTNNQYEPITVSDTSHDTFTKDNAVDYEEGEREGDNGRSYPYLASVTVELIDDVSGDTIGTISKLKSEDGEITWNAENNDGDLVAEEASSKADAQQALVDNYNKQKTKEFNREKAKGIKERTKQRAIEAEKAAKAKEKAEKEASKAKEKAAKEQAPVVKEQAAPPVKAEEKEDKEQKEPVKEQTEKEKAKEKAKEALRAKAAKINADVISAAQKVQQALEATGITVEVIDNEKDFQDKLDAEGVKRDSAAGASGVFISKSGKIFINASKVDAKWGSVDVWHEGTHPIINIIRNTNPKLYKSIIDGLNKLVASNPEIAAVVEWAQSNYEGENTLEDETITETIARIANGNIDLSKIPTSLKDKIVDFINGIAKSLGLKPMLKGSNIATFKKMAKEISAALREGKSISGIVGEENVKDFGTPIGTPSQLKKSSKTTKKEGSKVVVNKKGHKLSFVKESDIIDMEVLINDIVAKNQKVWF